MTKTFSKRDVTKGGNGASRAVFVPRADFKLASNKIYYELNFHLSGENIGKKNAEYILTWR